ncbi:MAG: hypothetical protein IPH04_16435 [Saprospirales bacterium]|nr:hypothetical protein [Saprospirales bacterium]
MNNSSGRTTHPSRRLLILAGLCGLLLLGSCYQKEEGCLDIRAVNFDVAADKPCEEECCTYPQLSVKLEHKAVYPDTVFPFRYDSLYYVASHPDVKFRFHRVRYYLSDIRLSRSNAIGRVTDSLTVYIPQSTVDTVPVRVVDDFILADRDFLQAFPLGTWDGEGAFDRLNFTIGLDEGLRFSDPLKIPSGHPLAAPIGGYNWEDGQGYISNFVRYSTEAQPGDTISVPITSPVQVSLILDPPLEIIQGYNIQLTLYINYLAWWEGLDLSTASPEAIEQHYTTKAANAFYQVEVTFN